MSDNEKLSSARGRGDLTQRLTQTVNPAGHVENIAFTRNITRAAYAARLAQQGKPEHIQTAILILEGLLKQQIHFEEEISKKSWTNWVANSLTNGAGLAHKFTNQPNNPQLELTHPSSTNPETIMENIMNVPLIGKLPLLVRDSGKIVDSEKNESNNAIRFHI